MKQKYNVEEILRYTKRETCKFLMNYQNVNIANLEYRDNKL